MVFCPDEQTKNNFVRCHTRVRWRWLMRKGRPRPPSHLPPSDSRGRPCRPRGQRHDLRPRRHRSPWHRSRHRCCPSFGCRKRRSFSVSSVLWTNITDICVKMNLQYARTCVTHVKSCTIDKLGKNFAAKKMEMLIVDFAEFDALW